MADILIAEDERNVREGVATALRLEGHSVRTARDGEAALDSFARERPDLVVLDVMMPRRNGFDVCAEMRRLDRQVPILILSAKSEEVDKVIGLGIGADDYVTKPFGMRELIARVAGLLRRAGNGQGGREKPSFTIGSCRVDVLRRKVAWPDGAEQDLTPRECDLLRAFAAHPGEVLGREQLLGVLWGFASSVNTRSLDQHVARIRKKLGSDAARIETVSGAGYRLVT